MFARNQTTCGLNTRSCALLVCARVVRGSVSLAKTADELDGIKSSQAAVCIRLVQWVERPSSTKMLV